MSNRSSQEDQILISIDQLRRRKTRTDLEGICNFMLRRFSVDNRQTIRVLNMMLTTTNARVMAVSCKGGRGTSYRRAKPGAASPVKAGAEITGEVATALLSSAVCEMILQEPDYLETGVPLDAFEKFMFKKDKVRFTEPTVLALVREELDKGNLRQLPDSGNIALARPPPVRRKQPGSTYNQPGSPEKQPGSTENRSGSAENQPNLSPSIVMKKVLVSEASKDVDVEAKLQPVKEEPLEAGPGSKAGSEGEESGSANGETPNRKEDAVEADGGRQRRKRAARVVFDPSDIPPPLKKRRPVKELANTTTAHGKPVQSLATPTDKPNQSRAPSTDKPVPSRLAPSSDKSTDRKPTPTRPVVESCVADGNSWGEAALVKVGKGYTRIPAKGEGRGERAGNIIVVKTYGQVKNRLAAADGASVKAMEVSSAPPPKPAEDKEAMRAAAAAQTQSIIQARLENGTADGKKTTTTTTQAKAEKLAFALPVVCYVCHRTADDAPLLSCADCANAAHVRCTERRDALPRSAPWRCVHCKTCRVCAETDEYAAMVVCCRCEDAYHLSCHPTQEEEEGSANWLCAKCIALPRETPPKPPALPNPAPAEEPAETEPRAAAARSPAPSRPPRPRDAAPDPAVPDVALWTCDEVADYFTGRGYHMQGKALRANEVDGSSLLLMRRSDVVTGLNLPLGPALKALRQVRRLQLRQDDDRLLWT